MNLSNTYKHAVNGNWPMAAIEALPTSLFKLWWKKDTGRNLYADGDLWRFSDGVRDYYLPRPVDALRLTHIGAEPRERVAMKYVGKSPWDLEDIDTVVDVGAYIGELHMFGFDGIAIEPDGRNYRCCVRNVPDDVATVNAAAWYEDKVMRFGEDSDGSESRLYTDEAHDVATESIAARPAGDIVAQSAYSAGDIDLVKIDAEGYEPEVVAGAVSLSTRFAIDVSPERHGRSTDGLCRALLASHGYSTERRGDVLYAE